MATGAEAIEVVAKVVGMLPATVGRAARALREAGKDQWPQAAPGGGKNSRHVEPRHLVNLALALAVADPITSAAEIVPLYRKMRVGHPSRWMTTPPLPQSLHMKQGRELGTVVGPVIDAYRDDIDPSSNPYLAILGNTVGVALDSLVDYLSRPSGERLRQALAYSDFALDVAVGGYGHPRAAISYRDNVQLPDGASVLATFTASYFAMPEDVQRHGFRAYGAPPTDAALMRTTKLSYPLFAQLAELWADTQARAATAQSSTPSGPSSAENGTDSENAEGTPAPSAPSDRSSSLDPQQGTEGLPRQGQIQRRIATRLSHRFDPILAGREGQARSPCRQGDMFGGHRSQTGTNRPRSPLYGSQSHSTGSALA